MSDDDGEDQTKKNNQTLKEIEAARLEQWQKWSDNYRAMKN